jgi:hypothetical protein
MVSFAEVCVYTVRIMNPAPSEKSPQWEVVNETGQARREPPILESPAPAAAAEHHSGPIHPMAATLMIVVDSLWMLAEWNALAWLLTIPLSFLSVFVPATLIQRFLHGNSFGKALAYGAFLGILAAVPTPILSTPAGLAALAWSGLSWLKKSGGKLTP